MADGSRASRERTCSGGCRLGLPETPSMTLTPISVECYAGGKADETPRRLVWEGHVVELIEVLDRWFQVESLPEWPRADYFKALGQDGHQYLLKHDLESDAWFLGQRW
jgi:hypothetical protein